MLHRDKSMLGEADSTECADMQLGGGCMSMDMEVGYLALVQ
jgi:hypothetical protein